jgi:hypothetical protein
MVISIILTVSLVAILWFTDGPGHPSWRDKN